MPDGVATRRTSTLDACRSVLRYARRRPVHLGSSLSVMDILDALLRRADNGLAQGGRSPVVLSKGHAVWALYALLAQRGHAEYQDPEGLPGHPTDGFPGVDVATGALGHGLSVAAGMAEGFRLERAERPVYVVLGDGELDEGSVWEAVMFAAHRRLDRLVAVVDVNGLQQEGATDDVLGLDPLAPKWRAFGWETVEVDGHDHAALDAALDHADGADRPCVVLARTVKGRGVSFMEHSLSWHVGMLDDDHLARGIRDLEDCGRTS